MIIDYFLVVLFCLFCCCLVSIMSSIATSESIPVPTIVIVMGSMVE